MISYYPPHLFPFLSLKSARLPSNLFRHYYLSWEDALWDILPQLGIKLGDTILLPDFYCLDVIENITLHGYKVAYYPLDHNFQISISRFNRIFHKVSPSSVIFFHVAGITNVLTTNQQFMERIGKQSLIIDDHVHRIIDSTRIKILHDRHLIIDSLRKNIPLPGSFAYSSKSTWTKLSTPRIHSLSYVSRVMAHYIRYRISLIVGTIFHSKKLIKFAHHTTLKTHDDLVGDDISGNSGLPWIPSIHKYLNLSKIRSMKLRQTQTYLKRLIHLTKSSESFSIPRIPSKDLGELHAFPFIINSKQIQPVEKALANLNVWSKFPDSIWSREKRIIFLPLGFHISASDQDLITSTIIKSLQTP